MPLQLPEAYHRGGGKGIDPMSQKTGISSAAYSVTRKTNWIQFRVLRLFDGEFCVAEIKKDTAAVWFPGHGYPVTDVQVVNTDVLGYDWIGAAGSVDVFQEVIPIQITERTGKDVQRAAPCFVRPFNIAPEPF